jgi:glycine/D-amino acid oxidase-like deaminating enzyme
MKHTRHGYWLEEAGPANSLPPLVGDERADVVVVGGGYTGMWTAWLIGELEPEARVVLLEAEGCGTGPSGRNGGFVNAMWFSLPSLRRRFGDGPALAVARAAAEAVEAIGQWCAAQDVDAWFRRAGFLHVSSALAQDGDWDEVVDACAELG